MILYAIYQRTQSESKSQPITSFIILLPSVCNLSKNTIWKQITTMDGSIVANSICMQSIKEHNLKANHNGVSVLVANSVLYAIYQRTQSESKSQLYCYHDRVMHFCMQSIKEHNLKANHNLGLVFRLWSWSVCNLSKNTIWKQITTKVEVLREGTALYAIYQRTQSESKSQLSMSC